MTRSGPREKGDLQSEEKLSTEGEEDLDDSVSKFERNLQEMLPGLQGSSSSGGNEPLKGCRRSERQKKPSSRFNSEAGFVPELPRSTKKKMVQEEATKGTFSKPLFFSDWTNAQLVSYCNACGVDFTDSASVFFNSLCLLELARSSNVSGQAETSTEVHITEQCL